MKAVPHGSWAKDPRRPGSKWPAPRTRRAPGPRRPSFGSSLQNVRLDGVWGVFFKQPTLPFKFDLSKFMFANISTFLFKIIEVAAIVNVHDFRQSSGIPRSSGKIPSELCRKMTETMRNDIRTSVNFEYKTV